MSVGLFQPDPVWLELYGSSLYLRDKSQGSDVKVTAQHPCDIAGRPADRMKGLRLVINRAWNGHMARGTRSGSGHADRSWWRHLERRTKGLSPKQNGLALQICRNIFQEYVMHQTGQHKIFTFLVKVLLGLCVIWGRVAKTPAKLFFTKRLLRTILGL